jgi:hypothetical protein
MTLQDFAGMTIEVVRQDGMEGYLPTLILTGTQEVRVIRGIPDHIDHRAAIQSVVRRSGHETEEFFFGVKSAAQEITIGHYRPGQPTEFMSITEEVGEYSSVGVQSCDWWNVG